MGKTILILAISIFVPLSIIRAQEISLALDEAVSIALRDNRDVLLKAEEVKKAKEKIAEAQGGLFPALTFTGSWTDTRGYYSKDTGSTTTQATIKQYLYKGGRIINTIKYNGYNFEVAQTLLDKAKLELILNVKKAWYTLLLANEFAGVNKGILDNSNRHLNFIRARYENGQASESDALKVKKSLAAVQEAYEASLNQVESTQALLANLLYLEPGIKIKPDSRLTYEPREAAYDEGFLKAIKMRPEIRQYEAQAKANKKAIEIARADNRPAIYASWDYYSRSHVSATSGKGWNDYNVLGFAFTWPIFDGWATKAKVEQAIADLKETQLNQEKTTRDIALELKSAYLDLKNALAEIKSAEAEADLYKDTLRVAQEKYKAGITSTLDVDDASLGYQVSLFNQKQKIYDYLLAKACFEKATGG